MNISAYICSKLELIPPSRRAYWGDLDLIRVSNFLKGEIIFTDEEACFNFLEAYMREELVRVISNSLPSELILQVAKNVIIITPATKCIVTLKGDDMSGIKSLNEFKVFSTRMSDEGLLRKELAGESVLIDPDILTIEGFEALCMFES